jgi:hypothetical protein
MTTLAHVAEAVRTCRIPVEDACDEVIDDAVLHREALARSIIGPGTRAEQHAQLKAYFAQSKEQA